MRYPQPVVLDATVVSNFSSTGGISFLTKLLDTPIVVPAVRDEIEHGLRVGHEHLADAVDSFDDVLPVRDVPPGVECQEIRDRLDVGEAASILGAIEWGGTVATDDIAARRVAEGRNLPVTGSIGLLVLGVERGRIGSDTADEWLDTWREQRGYYAPVERVSEILDDRGR